MFFLSLRVVENYSSDPARDPKAKSSDNDRSKQTRLPISYPAIGVGSSFEKILAAACSIPRTQQEAMAKR